MRVRCTEAYVAALVAAVFFGACEPSARQSAPVAPLLSQAANATCDVKAAKAAARAYFPGMGPGTLGDQAVELVEFMGEACQASDAVGYTDLWLDLAALVETTIKGGQAGSPSDGDDLMTELLVLQGPSGPVFDPCAGAAGCESWDGFPTPPDFVPALSPEGAWAVVSTGRAPVCSDHRSGDPTDPANPAPCTGVDPAIDGEAWGVTPANSWNLSFYGRRSLVFGAPSSGPSPTGEQLLGAQLQVYDWNVIPHPGVFPTNEEVIVGLCSSALASQDETVVQRASTILESANMAWCTNQSAALPATSFFGRLAELGRSLFSPFPRPLHAIAFATSPGGSAGSFSQFYVVDVDDTGVLEILNPPIDGTVGGPLLGGDLDGDGQPDPVRVLARTISGTPFTPLEQVAVSIFLRRNNGLVPSGNELAGPDCTNSVCTGKTEGDERGRPGTYTLAGASVGKAGAYRMCVTGVLAPFVFAEVCSEKFNIRPAKKN